MARTRILIVDDHQIVRDGIRRILDDENDIELIGSIGSGKEALGFIKCNQPDIVIADLSMPNMTGIELTEKLTSLYPDIKVLILSMFNNEEYIKSAIQAGAKGYLPKQDSTTEILLEAIRTIANGEEFYSPSISKLVMKSFVHNVKSANASDIAKKQQLTTREKEILKLYVEGYTNNEIAEKLNLSVYTIKTHKNNIMQKYNFKSTVEMIKFALRNNIVEW
jgi:DNA-binding NarL/FixJ family response regulator